MGAQCLYPFSGTAEAGLRTAGQASHFRLLELYDIEEAGKELTYEQVAQQFGVKSSDVTNYLAYARREFRRIVLEQLREMTGSEEEFRQEAQSLLGIRAVAKCRM